MSQIQQCKEASVQNFNFISCHYKHSGKPFSFMNTLDLKNSTFLPIFFHWRYFFERSEREDKIITMIRTKGPKLDKLDYELSPLNCKTVEDTIKDQ